MSEPSVTDAARAIVAMMREQYSAPATMEPVDAAEFGHLDGAAYAAFQAELEARGFRSLGDLEILEVSNSPTTLIARTFIRNMLSSDGRVIAQYYQLKPRIWRRLKTLLTGLLNLRWIDAPSDFLSGLVTRHCVGMESEFEDGRQLVTSNAEAASLMSGPPAIENCFFPYGTPTSDLYSHHLKRLKALANGDSPAVPLSMTSFDDVLAMQQRQSMLKVAHRRAMQWVTQSEIAKMSGNNTELGNKLFIEIQRLLRQEGGGV